MKKYNTKFFLLTLIGIISVFSLFATPEPSLAARGGRAAPVASAARKSTVSVTTSSEAVEEEEEEEVVSTIVEAVSSNDDYEEEVVITNKSSQFAGALSSSSSDSSKSDLAEKIRKQREALDARDKADAFASSQQNAMKSGKNACDTGLRDCMIKKCGSDFSKCALDGDTAFGDKLNLCRKDLTCSGEEFRLFTTEIKADRDLNAQLSSYTKVVECGNKYNDCMQKECGATFNKCLGKSFADRATKNCETIAKNCMEQDSGLAGRFGTAIGKLRESAEKEVKADEERMYKLRDDMAAQCKHLGAMFDERSFDCVYTVNFFAGDDQSTPKATRKAYAGNSFTCMQEWFGINVTTYKENAYRETRAQTAASSAMLGSGLGTATGLITSGAMGRALETQKAKKELKKECKAQGGKLKKGECVGAEDSDDEGAGTPDEEGAGTPDEEGAGTPDEEGAGTPDEEGAGTPDEEGAGTPDANAESGAEGGTGTEGNGATPETGKKSKLKDKIKENNAKIKENIKANNQKIKENNAKIKENIKANNQKIKENNAKIKENIKANNQKIKEGAKDFGNKIKDAFTIKKK